jgi:hypothetical protein
MDSNSSCPTVLIVNLPVECGEQYLLVLAQKFGHVVTCSVQDLTASFPQLLAFGNVERQVLQGVIQYTSGVYASAAIRGLNGYNFLDVNLL